MSVHVISWVLEHSDARLADRLVLLVLSDHAEKDGTRSYPSIETIAHEARVSRRKAQQALRSLEADGRIVKTGSSDSGTSEYAVVTGGEKFAPPGANSTAERGRTLRPKGGEKFAPKPSLREPSIEPSSPVKLVFDEWVAATNRDPSKTKLTEDRRHRIRLALASHGQADCVAAVRNIGRDAWAAGENDRGRRFDDIKHALGNAERIERWRDSDSVRPKSEPTDMSAYDRKIEVIEV